ncbi:hypothetical protein D3C80_1930260 [compost metagenome]
MGLVKTGDQVAGRMVEQAFEAMQVVHHHQQRILHVSRNHDWQRDRRLSRPC